MTFSWEIDDIESLQGIVKKELKYLGIRISKKKDTTKSHHAQDSNTSPLFGKALHLHSMEVDENSQCHVPSFLVKCTKFLDNHLNQEGIFRVSGSKARQRDLQHNFENGSCIPEDANPADICSLFKQFFRSLPEPLLIPRLQGALLKSPQFDDPAEQRWVVLNICYLLPPANLQTLRFIMCFLRLVAANSEVNRMDASNLAKVFTPNLMGDGTPTDKKNPERVIGLQTAVVHMLIENARLIGEVPEWMMERVRSSGYGSSRDHLDRLTSEDELDKSDEDNLEENSRPIRRRRRKSGSFQVLVSGLGHSLGILKTSSSADNILLDGTHSTDSPRIVKRKASEDIGSAFNSTKRKALLQKMTVDPQFSKPGLHLHKGQTHAAGTPMTPIQPTRPPLGEADAVTADGETLFRYGTPSIVYADDSFAGHTPSRLASSEMTPLCRDERWQETPKSKLKRFKELSAKKLKRKSLAQSLDGELSTKGNKTPGNKKKDSKDVGWRFANASPPDGGLDTMKLFEQPVRPSPNFMTPTRKRRHVKAPSSPARLLTGPSLSLARSMRVYSTDSEDAMHADGQKDKDGGQSSGDSPKVVIVDARSRRAESPQVLVVDASLSGSNTFSNEYKKNQEAHASLLMGNKVGKERTSPSVKVPETTRQIIKAAEIAFASMHSVEGRANKEPAGQNSEQKPEVASSKHIAPSVSQTSLSSVLSGVSICSHRSEFSHFDEEAKLVTEPKTSYMETAICSPCIVECKDDTLVQDVEKIEDSVNLESNMINDNKPTVVLECISKDEIIDFSDGACQVADETPIDIQDPGEGEDNKEEDATITGDTPNSPEEVIGQVQGESGHDLEHGRGIFVKTDSQDSGKGQSMEDLHKDNVKIDGANHVDLISARQESMDAGLGDEEINVQEEISRGSATEENVEMLTESKEPCQGDESAAEKQEQSFETEVKEEKINKVQICTKMDTCENDDKSVVSSSNCESTDVFKTPKRTDGNLCSLDWQSVINSALKSDLRKSLSTKKKKLPEKNITMVERPNCSSVKANIDLFNSFSVSQQNISEMPQGSHRVRSRREERRTVTRSQSRPQSPLTKSTSMDSGICDVRGSGRDMNESFLAAVGAPSKKKALSTSASMENISSPRKILDTSRDEVMDLGRPIQGSQSMQDINTPTSHMRSKQRQVGKIARPAQSPSKSRNTGSGSVSSPSSIKRRRPVSHGQKTAFQESDSFAKLRKPKFIEGDAEEHTTPPVRPLGDNNSPRLHRTRKGAPLDPRRMTPLASANLAPRTRSQIRSPGSRRPVLAKHRSPIKPTKRLGKTPSPARRIGTTPSPAKRMGKTPSPARMRHHSTPDENRIHKQYPRSPKNPLDGSSSRNRRQRSALPVHVQDEWEL